MKYICSCIRKFLCLLISSAQQSMSFFTDALFLKCTDKTGLISQGLISILSIFVFSCSAKPDMNLSVNFSGDAKIEVGGPFAGISFHHSAMIPQRISFFYPVANSIDHSKDYWTRDTSFVADWTLKIGDGPALPVGKDPAQFEISPVSVSFSQKKDIYSIQADYRFCQNKPAMVLSIQFKNTSDIAERFEFSYLLKTSIRTCHTFRLIDKAETSFIENAAFFHFQQNDADNAVVFVANAGYKATESYVSEPSLPPAIQYVYTKDLRPGEALDIVLIIGSAKYEESREIVAYLQENFLEEISLNTENLYNQGNLSVFRTGDPKTDHSIAYAKAVMVANAHYLDGEIVPMPCPAEYNFYFTHDVLVTNLAAVNFDITRVKTDLDYIIRHANEKNIIPHAYYWKDGRYVTEFADSDNWNNFWFVQVAAKYLRHSGDRAFVEKLFPYINTSMNNSLLTLERDNLMWSYRPDWWDIGHNYGPRTYMTILAIKSLRDYVFLATALNKDSVPVAKYASLADSMQTALTDKLWHDDMGYLMNYHNDGSLDEHYYIGSLLAAHYNLLNEVKQNRLVQTASSVMVDPAVGIYNAFPMDFEAWSDFMKFSGNEAGSIYYYFNGGIWPQGNAWYALALIANREKAKAAEFINNTMSLHGIMNGPNGQPAYYEVRNANRENPDEYGTVDKPQFLWAGAWYLNCLYQLYGIKDNGWNICLDPYLNEDQKTCSFSLYVNGDPLLITMKGSGEVIREIKYGKSAVNTAVFTPDLPKSKNVQVVLGAKPKTPILLSTQSILESCRFKNKRLELTLKAYQGHVSESVIISQKKPISVIFNREPFTGSWSCKDEGDYFRISVHTVHTDHTDQLVINYNNYENE